MGIGQTYLHTDMQAHGFNQPILLNQACAHSRPSADCGHVPGLKLSHKGNVELEDQMQPYVTGSARIPYVCTSLILQ